MINTGGIQLRLGDFVYAILKRWKLILALTFVGLVFGVMLSAVTYMQGSYTNFEVTSSFAVLTINENGSFVANNTAYQHPTDFTFAGDMVDTVEYVITSDLNMNRAIDSLKIIGIKPKDITQNLKLTQYNSTPIIEATLTWRDASEGVAILNAVLAASRQTLQETLNVGAVSVINEPAATQTLTNTLGGSVWGYMMILGFLAGIGFVTLELLMRPTLTNLKDVESVLGMETLGTIPKDDKYFRKKKSLLANDGIISPKVTQNYASTAYILRNRFSGASKPHCFYVTSTTTGEGKTAVAANLAVSLSDMEQKVLLIDMDTRNPTIGKLFLRNIDYDRSLNALYRGDATREEAVFTLTGYLDLLPTVIDRQTIPMDGTIFELIRGISKDYDYVIIDSSPVGQVSDVLSLNEVADTVLFVLQYDGATIPEIRSALEKLDKSGIRLLGCVVNAAQNIVSSAIAAEAEEHTTRRKSGMAEHPIWEKAENEPEGQVVLPEEAPKKGLFKKRRKNKTGKKPDPAKTPEQAEDGSSPSPSKDKPAEAHSVLDDIYGDTTAKAQPELSNEAASEALLKMGLEGDWESTDEKTPEEPEAQE